MRIDILTLFPEMFVGPFSQSLLFKAQQRGQVQIEVHSLRDFGFGKRRTVDARPYGGGRGMLLMAEPLYRAVQKLRRKGTLTVYLSPKGERLSQRTARELSGQPHLILVCGHYEGVDERWLATVDREISIGDYVLTGGEIPAMVLTDAVLRWVPGVVKENASLWNDSWVENLLEAPQYTRPSVWRGRKVPEVLLCGDHRAIADWRRVHSRQVTLARRPELLEAYRATRK
ncbi:MAG: tRNA (guanosine(37)-N1)-methyltransferase TrmD [Elusimicrobia bacterium]|nr:tRNA (guanosine(37)-N1)-methyltransferase TrmD [Elusimicrobiota bacterium]